MNRVYNFDSEYFNYSVLNSVPGVKLGIVFASHIVDKEKLLSGLEAIDFPVIGVTTHYNLSTYGVSSDVKFVLLDDTIVGDVSFALVEDTSSKDSIANACNQIDCSMNHKGIVFTTFDNNEEFLIAALNSITPMPWFGGTAGDSLSFTDNYVIFDAQMFKGKAVIVSFTDSEAFESEFVSIRSFKDSGKTITPTKLSDNGRVVYEFNGKPAIESYASILGIPSDAEYVKNAFFGHTLAMRYDEDTAYTKDLFGINEDGSISTASGLFEDFEYQLQDPMNMSEHTKEVLDKIGDTELIINVQCAFRTIQAELEGDPSKYYGLFSGKNMVGFSSLGEYDCAHVNHTSTLLIFKKR